MNKKSVHDDQQGFAALVIAITLVIVISLITVGFAQLMRNEVRETTNKQLSNQAYYAAESGVNDATKAVYSGYKARKSTCPVLDPADTAPGSSYLKNNKVSSNSEWTCLLIDSSPGSIQYGSVDTVIPTVFKASAVDAANNPINFNSITISWKSANPSQTAFYGSTGVGASFPSAANWTKIGMLRVAMTPLAPGQYNRDALRKGLMTAFFYPTSASNNNPYTYDPTGTGTQAPQGTVIDGNCSAGCSVTINGLNTSSYLFNLRSIYSKTSVTISGVDAASNPVRFADAQTLVDATGRAEDVLKRIQVRIPNKGEYYFPGFAAEAASSICKQLSVFPGGGSEPPCNPN